MKKLSVFLYTTILGKKMYDEFDEVLGELKDIYVTTDEGYPRVIGYKVKRDGSTFHYEFRSINFYQQDNKVKIVTRGSKEILPRTYSYLLSENLLDKKIVDINGKRVVRVDDLRIAEIAGEYRVIAVETGPHARFRRLNCERLGKFIYKLLRKEYDDRVLMWDDVESLEMVNKNNLQISIPYKKLSTLHPADLADILENLDTISRKQIIEALDEDLAADTLEQIEPEYKGTIIKELSETKAAELLENMPNDEIADVLDELNDDEREKILINLEKEDAEEVKELLSYKEETVGSIMSTDYISFNLDITVGEILDILRELEDVEEDELYRIYITDEEERVLGAINPGDLILNKDDVKIIDIMEENIDTIRYDVDIKEAIEKIAKYDLLSIPVVDEENKLIGTVNSVDLIDEVLYPMWKKKMR
ncbi:magnesium transporter [Clostridium isatidis]|uniref:magnesium transporter n=1 Tax=Clostridium isatidis TaxID=182773 RepID=UPI003AADB630